MERQGDGRAGRCIYEKTTIFEFEIEAAVDELITWLDDIEKGARPNKRRGYKNCVRMCNTDDGPSLIKGSPQEELVGRGFFRLGILTAGYVVDFAAALVAG